MIQYNIKNLLALRGGSLRLFSFLAFLFLPYAVVQADENSLTPSLTIGVSGKILDEYGNDLIGSAMIEPSLCDLVQILWATNGIFPPNEDGTPDEQNPVMQSAFIGSETCLGLDSPSIFALTILGGGLINPETPFFVRVYNASTTGEATFYADSPLVYNEADNLGRVIVTIPATTQAVNPEYAAGLDSDGDGMSDADEIAAGTRHDDPNSLLSVQMSYRSGEVLQWAGVSGKVYSVQQNLSTLTEPEWMDLTTVTAEADGLLQVEFPDNDEERAYYRIRLVTQPD